MAPTQSSTGNTVYDPILRLTSSMSQVSVSAAADPPVQRRTPPTNSVPLRISAPPVPAGFGQVLPVGSSQTPQAQPTSFRDTAAPSRRNRRALTSSLALDASGRTYMACDVCGADRLQPHNPRCWACVQAATDAEAERNRRITVMQAGRTSRANRTPVVGSIGPSSNVGQQQAGGQQQAPPVPPSLPPIRDLLGSAPAPSHLPDSTPRAVSMQAPYPRPSLHPAAQSAGLTNQYSLPSSSIYTVPSVPVASTRLQRSPIPQHTIVAAPTTTAQQAPTRRSRARRPRNPPPVRLPAGHKWCSSCSRSGHIDGRLFRGGYVTCKYCRELAARVDPLTGLTASAERGRRIRRERREGLRR